ncbi:MAG TPA: hypothetical protein ACHBX0_02465 [Arsenophonus sp.]
MLAMLSKEIFLIAVPQAIATQFSKISLSKAFPLKQRCMAQFPAYVELLKRMTRQQEISETTITRAFANIYFVQRIVAADRWQPERRANINLESYL